MTIDISSILKEFGGKIDISGEVVIDCLEFRGETYTFPEPLKIKGIVANTGNALVLTADADVRMKTRCARCLDDITVDVGFSMTESFVRSDSDAPRDEDTILFDGYILEIDESVMSNLIMNIKGRYLCSEDCLGLCPKCGINLNEGDCGCNREFIDPRWIGLASLMEEKN